jgi:hypothetical protein
MKASQDFGVLSADVVVVLGQVSQTPVGQLMGVVQLRGKIFLPNQFVKELMFFIWHYTRLERWKKTLHINSSHSLKNVNLLLIAYTFCIYFGLAA